MDKLSIVITTYNRSDALLTVLEALCHQSDSDFEVIIADDGSDENHRHHVLDSPWAQQLRAVYVWQTDQGFRAARVRNLGVCHSQGDYLVFLDGDCVPEVDFVHQHKMLARAGALVTGGRVLLSTKFTERVLSEKKRIWGRNAFFWIGLWLVQDANKLRHLFRFGANWRRTQSNFNWRSIRSCNLAVWRNDFVAVNGFDQTFEGWGHEDADLVLRLQRYGVSRLSGVCAIEVYHLWHSEAPRSAESVNADRVRQKTTKGDYAAEEGLAQSALVSDQLVTVLGAQ